MFGKKEIIGKIETIIAEGVEVKGDITSKSTVRIDGVISGHILKAMGVIVGKTGKVYGDLCCESAVIGGEILGKVIISKTIELLSTARVIGDIETQTLSIQDGAVFEGKCSMSGKDNGVCNSSFNPTASGLG